MIYIRNDHLDRENVHNLIQWCRAIDHWIKFCVSNSPYADFTCCRCFNMWYWWFSVHIRPTCIYMLYSVCTIKIKKFSVLKYFIHAGKYNEKMLAKWKAFWKVQYIYITFSFWYICGLFMLMHPNILFGDILSKRLIQQGWAKEHSIDNK